MGMTDWVEKHATPALTAGIASAAIGDQIHDAEVESELALVVEGLFRGEARYQYAGWPPGSTTDGSSVHLLLRSGDNRIDAYGGTDFDFSGEVFPFWAEFAKGGDGATTVRLSIGQVEKVDGSPPRLQRGTLIVPAEDAETMSVRPELIVGRHQVPITWTRAIEWPTPSVGPDQ